MEKSKAILLDALKLGAMDPGEHRLYRSGKLPGLFSGRTNLNAEAACQAVNDGFLEMVRSETKGKTTVEFVRVTPKGIDFLLQHESPTRMMEELQEAIKLNQEGIPQWVGEMKGRIETMCQQFTEDVQTVVNRLEQLSQRVQEAVKRNDKLGPPVPEGSASAIPWAHDAVEYLDQRMEGGLGEKCALPELFSHIQQKEEEFCIRDFHLGLRRLHDRGLIRLLPFEGVQGPPEPEYALLDGPMMYYFAAR